jgi:hypothetical protein
MTEINIDDGNDDGNDSGNESSENNYNVTAPLCGFETEHGPCEMPVQGGGLCYFHDEDSDYEVADSHGGQEGNLNPATHMLHVERTKLFENLQAFEELLVLGWYDDLLQQSVFDFQCERREHCVDCSELDDDFSPPTDEYDYAFILVPYPTQYQVQAESLFHATLDLLKMLKLDSVLLENGMERTKVVDSLLDEDSGEWNTLEEKDEHYLCLSYDRLIRSWQESLRNGGIPEFQ